MIDQCKHGHSDGVANISCLYCRVDVLEAELAAIRAAPTVAVGDVIPLNRECKAYLVSGDGWRCDHCKFQHPIPCSEAALKAAPPVPEETVDYYKGRWLDLIMQVGEKHPGESRHDTAKRYIIAHENHSDNLGHTAAKGADHD